ncbi:Hsp33 family molecular chaperone HslO [Salinicola aestuarinus]|uniref:Hsp33 family molecular chaperone HslO n=1 Tax=Salinicola aestuarinus TaxID=1949082 RepID=UPI000DA25FBF|nr:Hsp33 family molecular chaperone HslO [Salinicola aestuarinus]
MNDQIQRFLFDDTNVRGEIVQLERAYAEVLERQAYPEAIRLQLGELMSAVALLTETVKIEGTVSLEVRGKQGVNVLMAESNPGGQLRAIARYDEFQVFADNANLRQLIGDGQIVITLDPKEGKRYQGIVSVEHDSLAGCLEAYFAQSEQLATRLWLSADGTRGAGLLLQQLPDDAANLDPDAWNRLTQLASTITPEELCTVEGQDVLYRLFHEETTRVFEPKALEFGCNCTRERFADALHSLGAEELRSILEEEQAVDTQCHFCHTRYHFSAADIEAIIESPQAPSPTLH